MRCRELSPRRLGRLDEERTGRWVPSGKVLCLGGTCHAASSSRGSFPDCTGWYRSPATNRSARKQKTFGRFLLMPLAQICVVGSMVGSIEVARSHQRQRPGRHREIDEHPVATRLDLSRAYG